jgi:hypothetical protein
MGELVIESCHSTWVFDQANQQFRRLVKGDGDPNVVGATDWRPYFGLECDPTSDAFVVLLNQSGTRRLRSWRHLDGRCANCDRRDTTELSTRDITATARVDGPASGRSDS